MQKQRPSKVLVHLLDVPLSDEFPILFYYSTQKNNDRNKLHHHNSFEIGICIEGSGAFFIESKVISFNAGDISFIYPNQPHIAQSPGELPSRWIFMHVDLNVLFFGNSLIVKQIWECKRRVPHILTASHCADLPDIVKITVGELESQEQHYQLAVKELIMVFLYKLLRLQSPDMASPSTTSNEYYSVMPALAYIAQNYELEISINDLAQACNLSETHFRALFKEAMGRTPKQYLSYVRIEMAKTLLKSTDYPVLSIAQGVGYDSISSFNRTFISLYGITPSAYRRQYAQGR